MSGSDRGAGGQPARWVRCRCLSRACAVLVCLGVAVPGVAGAATFTVTTTANSGPGSLRQAIVSSNAVAVAGGNVIEFDVPAPVAPIAPSTDLPAITEPVLIDGLTQAGARANQDPEGFDAVLPIRLTGTAGTGFQTGAGSSSGTVTIRGVRVEGFATGIASESPDLQLEVLGSHVSGLPGDRAGRVGIVLHRSKQFDTVGGFTSADSTLVTDAGTGVRIAPGSGAGATGEPQVSFSIVRSNDVGVELAAAGTVYGSAIVENRVGVDIRAAGAIVFGDNLVANNASDGVVVSAGAG